MIDGSIAYAAADFIVDGHNRNLESPGDPIFGMTYQATNSHVWSPPKDPNRCVCNTWIFGLRCYCKGMR